MNTSWIQTGTRWFFWCGFGVFLAASIPHIATYYRHFDPVTADASNIIYWLIAYALAIVLDISDVLVSIAVMKAQGEGRRVRDVLPYWFFIAFITAFSWFVNWQYNVVFGTAQFHTVDTYRVGIVSIGQINPIIGSAFQILLLVYTGMAHKFSEQVQHTEKSLDDLKQEAAEAATRASYLLTIQAAQKQVHPSLLSTIVGGIAELNAARTQVFSSPSLPEQMEVAMELDAEMETSAHNTDDLEIEREHTDVQPLPSEGTEERHKLEDNTEHPVELLSEAGAKHEPSTDPEVQAVDLVPFRSSRNKATMTVKEAALFLNCSERHVRNLRNSGTLASQETGLSTKSIKAYARKRQKQTA